MPTDFKTSVAFMALQQRAAYQAREQEAALQQQAQNQQSGHASAQQFIQMLNMQEKMRQGEFDRNAQLAELYGKSSAMAEKEQPQLANARLNEMAQVGYMAGEAGNAQKQNQVQALFDRQRELQNRLDIRAGDKALTTADLQIALQNMRGFQGQDRVETTANAARERTQLQADAAYDRTQLQAGTSRGNAQLRADTALAIANLKNERVQNGGRLSMATVNKLKTGLNDLGQMETQLQELTKIPDGELREFLSTTQQIGAKLGQRWERFADVPEDIAGLIRQQAGFDSRVGRAFDAYRRLITGAAAANSELAGLKLSFINTGMSVSQFRGTLDAILAGSSAERRRLTTELSSEQKLSASGPPVDAAALIQVLQNLPDVGAPQ
jgi:hypothetical protein